MITVIVCINYHRNFLNPHLHDISSFSSSNLMFSLFASQSFDIIANSVHLALYSHVRPYVTKRVNAVTFFILFLMHTLSSRNLSHIFHQKFPLQLFHPGPAGHPGSPRLKVWHLFQPFNDIIWVLVYPCNKLYIDT